MMHVPQMHDPAMGRFIPGFAEKSRDAAVSLPPYAEKVRAAS
jgi:hypothetical protein